MSTIAPRNEVSRYQPSRMLSVLELEPSLPPQMMKLHVPRHLSKFDPQAAAKVSFSNVGLSSSKFSSLPLDATIHILMTRKCTVCDNDPAGMATWNDEIQQLWRDVWHLENLESEGLFLETKLMLFGPSRPGFAQPCHPLQAQASHCARASEPSPCQ